MQPWCSRRTYQDMTRPLSDYFINASHNTYLFDNHGNDKNNPEVYNQALRAGCRVIEIDCYDGHDGQPVVKHEYSSVKAYPFESVIHFIEPNLFKTSPYPVILSIENHCSIKQQKEIARILKEILGNRLITEPPLSKSSWMLPSPENLKHKVLVRSIKSSVPIKDSKLLKKNDKFDNPIVNNGISDLFIYLENVPFRDYNYTKDHYMCLQLPSLSEKEFKQASHCDPFGLIKQTRKCLLRIHSDNSNNPNPIDPWNFGIQIVAVNYQNNDSFMELCHGKFLDNGKCGYILKPNYLMHSDKAKFNPLDYLIKSSNKISKNILEYPQRLIITIISGQFLYRSNRNKNDISNPYVVVSTHGIVCDKQIQKTKFIQNNGLNPLWNETFEFEISFPQMCLICFDVYDYDIYSHDDHLAYFCLPLTTIQTGYRHIYLRTKDRDSTYSSLFVHVVIENT
ncbi:unnamed protein product [Adineta steineri]|uniref:Phosphoinositide phospholipase C n=1 Tax=Adineta steineri TaxID=433720 RepID=A0A816FLM5_9BILA|nr:unnamed protein product [Adineta steineri]CAF1663050.1 unnamed protein product [Adineta steineri]